MSVRFRASKYRHSVGTVYKKENWYPDLRPSTSSSDAQCIAASNTNLAYVLENGTSISVLPQVSFGKRVGETGKIHAHSAQIYDIQYSPHNDNLLATSGDDCTVKLWKTPEGFTGDISESAANLQGHKKRVGVIRFHPTAANVIASGSHDSEILIWDVDGGQQLKLEVGAIVHSLTWSNNGELLAVTSADNKTSIWDPRGRNSLQVGTGHQGVKPSRSVWLGNKNRLATTGFSGLRERQFFLWDTRDLSKPVNSTTIDASTGILEPFYDNDTSVFYLAGKGDGNIRAYEITDTKPFQFEITQFISDLPTKSICSAPKTSLDVMNCEIAKLFKLTTNSIVPIGFTVPRKSKQEFPEDLFPPTAGPISSLSGSDWFGGLNADPVIVSLNPAHKGERQEVIIEEQLKKEQENVVEVVQKELPKLNIVRSSKFRHVTGKLAQKNKFYENVKADNSSSESETIKANQKYFAVPWSGPGGQVGVFPLNKPGRLSDTPGLLECGSAQLDLDWNPFDDDILVTGLEDARIKIWKIPEGLHLMKKNYTSEIGSLKGHYSKVTITKFHPVANNVLASSSYDLSLKLWDITQEREQLSIAGHLDIVQSVCFNANGSVIASSCKDKKLRLIDPRATSITAETPGHQGAKATKLAWLGSQDRLLSVGFSRQSEREFSIWDTRNFSTPVTTHIIDVSAGVITPFFEEGTGIVYFAGKGDGTISYYEIDDQPPYAHFLSKFQTSNPQMGFAPFSQRFCDVKEVELFKGLKLTTSSVEPVSFSVPRTRKEYFQDDIYPPAVDGVPSLSAADWFRGENKDPIRISLKPADLINLSEAPAIKREIKYNFEEEVSKKATGTVTKEQVMGKFYQQITNNWKEDEFTKKEEVTEVDDDEWDD